MARQQRNAFVMSPQFVERAWPYALAAASVVSWWAFTQHHFPTPAGELLSATGTAASVLIGFLITAKAIILGLTGSPVFKKLIETGFHRLLFAYLYEATWGSLLLLMVSIFGYFVTGGDIVPLWFKILWIISAVLAVLLFVRISRLLFKLLRQA